MGAVTFTNIQAAEWTLRGETGEGVPQGVYSALCVACGEEAEPVDDESLPVEVWALKHTGLNPTHRQYKAMVESFWRVDPAPGNPYSRPNGGSADRLAPTFPAEREGDMWRSPTEAAGSADRTGNARSGTQRAPEG